MSARKHPDDMTKDELVHAAMVLAICSIEACLHVIDDLGGDPGSIHITTLESGEQPGPERNVRAVVDMLKQAFGVRMKDVEIREGEQ